MLLSLKNIPLRRGCFILPYDLQGHGDVMFRFAYYTFWDLTVNTLNSTLTELKYKNLTYRSHHRRRQQTLCTHKNVFTKLQTT